MKIAYKVLIVVVVTIFGSLTLTTSFELSRLQSKLEAESESLHVTITANLVENLAAALFNVDRQRIVRQLQSAFQFGNIERVIVIDDSGKPLAAYRKPNSSQPAEAMNAENLSDLGFDAALFTTPHREHKPTLLDMIESENFGKQGSKRLTTTLWFTDDDRKIFVGHLIVEFGNAAVKQAIRQSVFDKVASASFLAIIMSGLTFFLLRSIVFLRLEELKRSVKRVKARDYSTPIVVKGRDEISVLARAFRDMVQEIQAYQKGLEEKVIERTRDLQRSRDKIKTILDNIEQGIVTFSDNFKIDSEFSRKTAQILGLPPEKIAGQDLHPVLLEKAEIGKDQLNQLDEALNCSIGQTDDGEFRGDVGAVDRSGSQTEA